MKAIVQDLQSIKKTGNKPCRRNAMKFNVRRAVWEVNIKK